MNPVTGSILLGSAILVLTGCATTRQMDTPQMQEATSIQDAQSATIVFNKEEITLDPTDRKALRRLIKRAQRQKEPIEEIRILAWSDNEYPDKVTGETSPDDIRLARDRGIAIKEYLEEELADALDVNSYNMARRPDLLSKLFRDDEFQVKEAVEQSGATATRLPDGSVSYTKASKAIVIIDYVDE